MSAGPSKFDRLPKTLASIRSFNVLYGVFAILVGAVLYLGHAAFIPVAMSLLLALVLSSPVEALQKVGVPRSLSAVLILILTLSVIGTLAFLLWNPAQDWYASAPKTLAAIQKKVTPLAHIADHLQALAARAGWSTHQNGTAVVAAAPDTSPAAMLEAFRDGSVSLAAVIFITLFLLAGGPPMMARMTAAFFDHLKANHVLAMIEKIRREVGLYYVVTALINVGLGIATTVVMMAWHMPTPYVWGALAALLNFIPYVGSATVLLTVFTVAIVSLEGVGRPLGVAASYLALATLEGQVVQPLLVGRRLEVNPLLIFLGLWFGGMFWGIAGVVLATPALVVLKVVAENAIDGTTMLDFLGPNPEPPSRTPKSGGFLAGAKRLARIT
jgi:predicted PurR-regulated permease PerM